MSGPRFAITGRVGALAPADRRRLVMRSHAADDQVTQVVAGLIAEVRSAGDDALRRQTLRFDGVEPRPLEVPRTALRTALASLPGEVRAALWQAREAIASFHRAQLPEPLEIEPRPGLRLGRRAEPLRRIGVYAPGGRAAYPSSVLMGVVPARVAGVEEVVLCSPPGPTGLPSREVLAAAAIAGADRVFAVGGAGAIAAMALGTASVPRVDRIVGQGNAYVTEAKQQLARVVAIDSPAGPSEILVLADDSARPELIAAELLAQAEHDPDACCVLVTTAPALPAMVAAAIAQQLADQPRRAIIERALAASGALLVADDVDEAIAFADEYAPEHLRVLTRNARVLLPRLRNAGSIFLGASSAVAFGDYTTGANHVLPTGGSARIYSGLSTLDFVRFSTWQELDARAAVELAPPTSALALAEGLPAHAAAAHLHASAPATPLTPAPPRLRPEYASLAPYDPGRDPCETDLSDNTNLWGPHPAAAAALRSGCDGSLSRYPSVYASPLKRRLAELLGIEPSHIATGCGSDDVIDSALRAFCAHGERVAYPDPTFGMIPVFAQMNAACAVPVPCRDGFALDVDALLRVHAGVTYVCRPNNPTGTLSDIDHVRRLEDEARGVVLVDEAYIDFARDAGVAGIAAGGTRTIALRTLSKAWGVAGLRIGFAVGPERLVQEIEKARGPYKVSALAEHAALAALRDNDWVSECAARVIANRERLTDALRGVGLHPLPSAANFLLVPLPAGAAAADWNLRLRARGVAVRPFAALTGAGECIRVTIGPWSMMQRFVDASAALLDETAQRGTRQ